MAVLVWRAIAVICIACGLVGIVVPILPTVPFLLAAAGAASRGWPWLDEHLTSHATYGPYIVRWRERRAIPRSAKWFATLGMTGTCLLLWVTPVPRPVPVVASAILLVVGWWIWTRPEA